jgi:hypothetical protein
MALERALARRVSRDELRACLNVLSAAEDEAHARTLKK